MVFRERSEIGRAGAQQSIAAAPTTAEPAEPAPHLSIVVLPFTNLSGDASQDYFADGVTESLTTDLSRLSGAFVIARNTAFTFKGKSVDAREIGKELGVRYVLEGSVQWDQGHVRSGSMRSSSTPRAAAISGPNVSTCLYPTSSASRTRLSPPLPAMGAQLVDSEARRAERAAKPDSMDLYWQGSGRQDFQRSCRGSREPCP